MTFDIGWWWKFQEEISVQFDFSKIREDVASRLVSDIKQNISSIRECIEKKDLILVGAGLQKGTSIPSSNVIVADGALRACLEQDILPSLIVTDLDGYIPDILWARKKGSKVILHAHGDNIARVFQYLSDINPNCITTTYPSASSNCWGGFTDGDRALMMSLSLNCNSVKMIGFNYNIIGNYSGDYSPRKLEKLLWAQKIVEVCIERSNKILV
ncbi:MAG: DUF115 domain-containing protein [Candidatus Poseidoniia archaeon]|nr:DUF115 domain-containing protein [Candidatus Poseidoniia archaeon]